MKPLKGHALRSGTWRRLHSVTWYGICECGESPKFQVSGVKVRAWHRAHKTDVRQKAEKSLSVDPEKAAD